MSVSITSLSSAFSHVAPPTEARHAKLVESTKKWVAMSFFEPLLKQIRHSPFRSKLLDGGEGGQAFGALYDERMAERMTTSASNSLVNSIVRKIEAKSAYSKQPRSIMNKEREGADRAGGKPLNVSASASGGGGAHVATTR